MTTPRPHLAIFLRDLQAGGAERNAAILASRLVRDGYRVDLVLARAEGPFLSRLDPAVRLFDLRARRMATSLPGLLRYLRRERPEVLLSKTPLADLTALAAKRLLGGRDTRYVITAENDWYAPGVRPDVRQMRLALRLIPLAYPWADGIISVSGGVADSLARYSGLPRERLEVIYNPVLGEELFRAREEPLTHPWFAPGQPPVVLAVGRLSKQKDHATLLRAFAPLRAERPARLLILGEGPERGALSRLAEELALGDDVALPGFAPNPFAYMARAAAFALSSRWEGLPNVLIEALACGSTIVSTDCPSGAREILAGGRYGQLVPVADPPALAAALRRALEGDRRPVDAAWLRQFTPEYAVARYREVLGLGAPPAPGAA